MVPAGQGEREIGISPALLFRFSALTYNAHRIHYDRDYCRDVEGYPGLLTHGPLQALAMAEAARAAGGTGGRTGNASFAYRLVSPLFDDQGLIVGAVQGRTARRSPPRATVTAARQPAEPSPNLPNARLTAAAHPEPLSRCRPAG